MKAHQLEALEILRSVPYARTHFLSQALGGSFQRRRKELGELGLTKTLQRHDPLNIGAPRYWSFIYSLPGPTQKFDWHNVKAADITLSLAIAAKTAGIPFEYRQEILKGGDFRLPCSISWDFDRHKETCNLAVQPDDIVCIDGQYYLLEFDNGTETEDANTFKNKKSWLRSLLQYVHVFRNKTFEVWGIPDLKLLCVFDNVKRMHNVMALMEKKLGLKSARILFAAYPQLNGTPEILATGFEKFNQPRPLYSILNDEWLRVGHRPFTITRPKEVSDGHTEATRTA